MTLDVKQYRRRPLTVSAVRVTSENLDEIAEWCGGTVVRSGKVPLIQVPVQQPKHQRQVRTRAFINDLILLVNDTYRVYTSKAFNITFELIEKPKKSNAVGKYSFLGGD